MKKVLILGVASVQFDAIKVLKELGVETYACAQAPDGPGCLEADHFEKLNFTEIEKVIDFIKKNQIDCVYSVGSDLAMPICSEISEKLSLPHFVSAETAKICNNKNRMREFFGDTFKGNVKYQIIDNIDTHITFEYPFIMKPSDAQGQRGVRLIKNYSDFLDNYEVAKKYSRSGLVILEQYIDGPELSVNAYMVNGEAIFVIPSDRIVWSQFQGGLIHKHIVPSSYITDQTILELIDLVEDAAEKLNILNGPLYFQIKLMKNRPYIIEVTPRLDGCHMWNVLEKYTNVNLIKLTFEHLLYNNVNELNKYQKRESQYVLTFKCQEPNTNANYSQFTPPECLLDEFNYYNEGDLIRPINNQFEKIGYYISEGE